MLDSIVSVGSRKLIGYLPIYTSRDLLKLDPAEIISDAETRNLSSIIFDADECCIKSDAFYIHDHEGLQQLLQSHAPTLAATYLSSDPEQFVGQIAAAWLEPSHPAYAIVTEGFGNLSHSTTPMAFAGRIRSK